MSISNFNLRKRLGMKLAQDDGAGNGGSGATTGGEGANNTGGSTGEGAEGSEGDKSFDDVLKDKRYQSEFDKRVAKALETAKSSGKQKKLLN